MKRKGRIRLINHGMEAPIPPRTPKPGPYYIVVGNMSVDYGEEGASEHLDLDGVIGPFATFEEADAFPANRFDRTDVVRMTAPADLDSFYENKYIWEN